MRVTRLDPKSRRKMIVDSAIKCARRHGLFLIDYAMVAEGCDVPTSEATVRRYFHTSQELRDAVVACDPALSVSP